MKESILFLTKNFPIQIYQKKNFFCGVNFLFFIKEKLIKGKRKIKLKKINFNCNKKKVFNEIFKMKLNFSKTEFFISKKLVEKKKISFILF